MRNKYLRVTILPLGISFTALLDIAFETGDNLDALLTATALDSWFQLQQYTCTPASLTIYLLPGSDGSFTG